MKKETLPPQLDGIEGRWLELTEEKWIAEEKVMDSPSPGERSAYTKLGHKEPPGKHWEVQAIELLECEEQERCWRGKQELGLGRIRALCS